VNVDGGTAIRLETQTHAVGIIQPPPDIRAIVDKTAQFVARNGPDFEKRILGSEKNNQKFNFLLPTDPYNAYYQSKIAAFKEEAAGGDDATVQAKAEEAAQAAAEKSGITVVAGTGAARAKVLQAPKKAEFTVNAPDGVASRDLDVIKLTAQFAAKHGEAFVAGIKKREHANPEFAFLKPTHSMHGVFNALADAYAKALRPPKNVDALLRKDEDKSAVLERALQRLEWERSQDLAKKAADDEAEKEREAFALIDWHDFAVVETIDFEDGEDDELPEPMTLRDIVAQLRDAEAPPPSDAAPGRPSAAATNADARAGGDVEMDEEEKAMIDAGAAAAAPAGPPGPAPGMKIVRDHKKPEVLAAEAKARAAAGAGADATKFAVSPITGELIAVDDMAEHMRVSLIDPKWKTQKEAMLAKLKGSTTANDDEVAANVLALARTRPDIFGTTDEEVSNAVAESIEKKKLGTGGGAAETGAGGGLPPAIPPPPPPVRMAVPAPPAAPMMPPPAPPPVMGVLPSSVITPAAATGPALKAAPAVPMPPPVSALRPLGPGMAAPPPPVAPPAPPPVAPPEDDDAPASKKRKVGEMELETEEDFLALNGGSGVIKVTFPSVDGDDNLVGQTVDLNVTSLSSPVSELKKLIKEAAGGLAANKQKISFPGLGFFTDKNSLAYYNIKYGTTLQLSLKERGGRKK
jgi:splicing factor 3A subunit 1